jgi:hypothetical protein
VFAEALLNPRERLKAAGQWWVSDGGTADQVPLDRHGRKRFAGALEPQERYLWQRAGQDARRGIAWSFVLVARDNPMPLGYTRLEPRLLCLPG